MVTDGDVFFTATLALCSFLSFLLFWFAVIVLVLTFGLSCELSVFFIAGVLLRH